MQLISSTSPTFHYPSVCGSLTAVGECGTLTAVGECGSLTAVGECSSLTAVGECGSLTAAGVGIGRLLFGFGRSSHILPPPKAGSLLGTSSETLARALHPQIPDKDRAPLPKG